MATNLEVHTGLLHYCTFGLDAANDHKMSGYALVLSPLRAQQFGILCLTVCMIQLLGLISFDVT